VRAPDTRWRRLSPFSPIVRAGRGLVALVIVFVPQLVGHGGGGSLITELAVVGGLVALGAVSWLVTRWRIDGNALRIETGLVRRSSMRYPLARIQAVDVVRPGIARAFGVSELRIRMGGTGGAARLAYLGDAEAEALRERLLALARDEGYPGEPAARDETVLVRVSTGRLAASILLSGAAMWLFVVAVAAAVVASVVPSVLSSVGSSAFVWILGGSVAVYRRFNSGYAFTAVRSADGLRVRGGLVQTTAETIPSGRVQAVQLTQPFLWQPFGWCSLAVDVAGRVRDGDDPERRSEGKRLRTVLPVGTRADARALLDLLVPGAPAPEQRPPRRARWKSPLRYPRLQYGFDERYAVATTGRLARIESWVPLAKVQSLRRVEGPVQRRLRVATLHLDTAGRRVGASLRDLDAREADDDLVRLTDLARAARR
jgi:putative membrane protein